MSQGILGNAACKEFYKEINLRKLCAQCREERKDFAARDKKHNESYSNMIPGFSSPHLTVPIDTMIIAEAHGGGRADAFREQGELQSELEHLEKYYLEKDIIKFHQAEIRKLIFNLNALQASWVFTDLVKCFVWQGNKINPEGKVNFRMAIGHCSAYLTSQIDYLRPKTIISLRKKVAGYFEIKNPKHGKIYHTKGYTVLHSIFPSGYTADTWVANKEWLVILRELKTLLKQNN